MSTTRNYAHDYLEARIEVHVAQGGEAAGRGGPTAVRAAEDRAYRIGDEAYEAGIEMDRVVLDDQARRVVVEYRAARQARHAATSMREQETAERVARRIELATERKGVYLDVVTLDEQARLEVFPETPRATRTI